LPLPSCRPHKAKQKQAKKEEAKKSVSEDVAASVSVSESVSESDGATAMDTVEEGEETKKRKEKKEPEPEFEIKNNPARILPQQSTFTQFNVDSRYTPVKTGSVCR
jgi:26S proteasome regulatory subunit N2